MDPVTAASSFSAGRFEPANDDALDRLLAGFCLPAGVSARLSDRFRAEAAAAGAPESAAERAEAALTAWFAEVLGAPERALSRGPRGLPDRRRSPPLRRPSVGSSRACRSGRRAAPGLSGSGTRSGAADDA